MTLTAVYKRVPEGYVAFVQELPGTNTQGETLDEAKVHPMKIRYFADTDTLFIEFRDALVAETRDLDENTLLDVDANGNICAITIEHASQRADSPAFSYEHVAA